MFVAVTVLQISCGGGGGWQGVQCYNYSLYYFYVMNYKCDLRVHFTLLVLDTKIALHFCTLMLYAFFLTIDSNLK